MNFQNADIDILKTIYIIMELVSNLM